MSQHKRANRSPSRRTALGLLGAGSLAVGGSLVGFNRVLADESAPEPAAGEPNSSDSRSGSRRPVPKDLLPGGEFDRFVGNEAEHDRFSGVVMLLYRRRPVLRRTYGWANRAKRIPVDRNTLFNLGSMSKFFTSTAIAQLVHDRELRYHDTVGTYLDGYPTEVADNVSIHHLLTHTSGLDDYFRVEEWQQARETWKTPEEAFRGTVRILRTMPLHHTPGLRYRYSNAGFYILTEIITKLTGTLFWDHIRRSVFEPIGLRKTDYYTAEAAKGEEFAHGYSEPGPDGERRDLTADNTGLGLSYLAGGAGGGHSNAEELLRFFRAVFDGTLLRDNQGLAHLLATGKHAVREPDRNPSQRPEVPMFSGYGLDEYLVHGARVISRTGTSKVPGGISVGVSSYPDLEWETVLLSNYYFEINRYHELLDRLIARG